MPGIREQCHGPAEQAGDDLGNDKGDVESNGDGKRPARVTGGGRGMVVMPFPVIVVPVIALVVSGIHATPFALPGHPIKR